MYKLNNLKELDEYLVEIDCDGTTYIDDGDTLEALIGMTDDGRLVYDYDKLVYSVMLRKGLDTDEAYDYVDINIVGAVMSMGSKPPIIMYPFS